MRALVTGGAGFIGSNIVRHLIDRGDEVTIFDNLSSGNFKNINALVQENKINFINGDLVDFSAVEKACVGQDAAFHLGASVGRQKSIDKPVLDSESNVIGTINLLEGMRKHNVQKIVYSSSAAIFGELLTSVIDENHPQNADSPYGVSKLAAEKMVLSYSGIYGIKGVCLRYFNIYGKNQRFDMYGNVIPIFAKRLFSHQPITIYGDGEQTRDFLNVEDVAKANFLGALYKGDTDVFNLGSGSSITINYLAQLMQEITGIKTDIKYEPPRPADVRHCKANISKAKEKLNFVVDKQFEKGLEEYLVWFEQNCV